jgi:hypothetical protein
VCGSQRASRSPSRPPSPPCANPPDAHQVFGGGLPVSAHARALATQMLVAIGRLAAMHRPSRDNHRNGAPVDHQSSTQAYPGSITTSAQQRGAPPAHVSNPRADLACPAAVEAHLRYGDGTRTGWCPRRRWIFAPRCAPAPHRTPSLAGYAQLPRCPDALDGHLSNRHPFWAGGIRASGVAR